MKRFGFSFALLAGLASMLSLTACVSESGPLTGNTQAVVLDGAVFTQTERLLDGNTQMVVRGTVKNTSKVTWSPVWIVEGQFYSDSTFTYKLGGTTKSFTYSLAKGETTAWELKFTSSTVDLSDYPRFAVKNLRVVQ